MSEPTDEDLARWADQLEEESTHLAMQETEQETRNAFSAKRNAPEHGDPSTQGEAPAQIKVAMGS